MEKIGLIRYNGILKTSFVSQRLIQWKALKIKRRIDKSNQDRTDMVEKLDDYFLEEFKHVKAPAGTRINSETPAWLLDRMSILMLKIYHMKEQTERKDVSADHVKTTNAKLAVLMEQKSDMQLPMMN